MKTTKIEWANMTANPMIGCSHAGPACDHCYAARMAVRHGGNPALPQYKGLATMTPQGPRWTGEGRWVDGVLEKLTIQLARSKAQGLRIFVGSMTDIAHENAKTEHLARILAFAAANPRHNILLLTKRIHILAERMAEIMANDKHAHDMWDAARVALHDACRKAARHVGKAAERSLLHTAEYIGQVCAFPRFPLPNVWLGATIWDQPSADRAVGGTADV